jgi:acetolactate synthase-1/2/3 large subunit
LVEIEAGQLKRPRTACSKKITQDVVEWRKHAAAQAEERPPDGIHPADVVARMRVVMGPQDLIGADTGAIGSWGGTLFPVEAGKAFVRANGSLGWVVPGVMGAAMARPQHRAVALTGDGGILYHIAELETALRLNIPIVIVALNNSCLPRNIMRSCIGGEGAWCPRCWIIGTPISPLSHARSGRTACA